MRQRWLVLLTSSTLVLGGVTSCAMAPTPNAASEVAPEITADAGAIAQKVSPEGSDELLAANRAVAQRPQLIKRADLALSVDSVETAFQQVAAIVKAQQGDVVSLSDEGHLATARERTIVTELRVPQEKLEATLAELMTLGSLERRSITTEDVASQLVDLQARLTNARKSEEALQALMERSGEIADVLAVSRELSTVRQSIEQMAAQQQALQTQVRYSTIRLSLRSAIATGANKPAFTRQVANTWIAATDSVGNFTTDLLQLGIWLLVYSPYLVALLCGAVAVRHLRRRWRAGA